MRGIGKGQTITLFIIPEVKKLIDAEVNASGSDVKPRSLIASVAAWLTCNSMRSERLQFMALSAQNMKKSDTKHTPQDTVQRTHANSSIKSGFVRDAVGVGRRTL